MDGLFGLLEEPPEEVSCRVLTGAQSGASAEHPLGGADVEACIGEGAVQVGMGLGMLVPGTEDGGATHADTEAVGISGDDGEGLGGGPEQDAADLEGDPGERRRQGEEDG